MTTKQCDSDKNHSSVNVNSKTYTREEIEHILKRQPQSYYFQEESETFRKVIRQCLARIDQLEHQVSCLKASEFRAKADVQIFKNEYEKLRVERDGA